VKYDRSDLTQPLPLGMKMWCLRDDERFHPCKVLERKARADYERVQGVIRTEGGTDEQQRAAIEKMRAEMDGLDSSTFSEHNYLLVIAVVYQHVTFLFSLRTYHYVMSIN
jgi:hypothetical protein